MTFSSASCHLDAGLKGFTLDADAVRPRGERMRDFLDFDMLALERVADIFQSFCAYSTSISLHFIEHSVPELVPVHVYDC